MISTGGSLVEAARALKEHGALDVYAAIVHPILAGPAVERLQKSDLKELIVTNSIPLTEEKQIFVASQPFESAPFILFRSGNYSGKPGASEDFDRFLRIVARDLLSNVTDIRIPLYVKSRDFSVSTLETGTSRYERGP